MNDDTHIVGNGRGRWQSRSRPAQQTTAEDDIRHLRVYHERRIVAEFYFTVGVLGAVFAFFLAAFGAIAAVFTKCSIEAKRQRSRKVEDRPSSLW